jgi:FkbM family methyltransferase
MSSPTPIFGYITTCKGRLSHLKETLPRIVDQPYVQCTVVDYDCPDGTADWVRENYPSVVVVKATDEPKFNASRARNLGARFTKAPWLGFFDADILLDAEFWKIIPQLKRGHFYRAHPVTYQTWGSVICHRADFEAVGGYDEAYTGWGGEDDDLLFFLRRSGIAPVGFKSSLLGEIAHDDELRTRFSSLTNRWMQARINQLYLQAKADFLQLRGLSLEPQEATKLYQQIEQIVRNSEAAGNAGYTLTLPLPPSVLGTPPQEDQIEIVELQCSIIYSVTPRRQIPNPGIPPSNIPMLAEDTSTIQMNCNDINGRWFQIEVPRDHPTETVLKEVFTEQDYVPVPFIQNVATIVDVGANSGIAAAYFRTYFPQAAIHCFEPDPGALAVLSANAEAISNCTVHPYGLDDSDRRATLFLGRDGTATNSIFPNRYTSSQQVAIELRNADTAIGALGLEAGIDILKLDTEGCELAILTSLSQRLPAIRVIYLEFHAEDDRQKIDTLLGQTHALWRAKIHVRHRGLCVYVLKSEFPEDVSDQPLARPHA